MKIVQKFTSDDFYSYIVLMLAFCIAFIFYRYGLSFPEGSRIGTDAWDYFVIASGFNSIPHAMSYVGNRTYGFPLFLYIIKIIFSPIDLNDWAVKASYVQFSIHTLTILSFYYFFIKKLFQKISTNNKFFTAIIAGVIIVYPPLVIYTSLPLSDTFCADLIIVAAIFYFSLDTVKKTRYIVILAFLCGLILGYAVLVRPSFWPPIMAFYFGILIELFANIKNWNKNLFKFIVVAFGTSILILPTMRNLWNQEHTIGIQKSAHFKNEKNITLHDGLAGVRIMWSTFHPSPKYHPGIYDPLLKKVYYDQCVINTVSDWSNCLLSKPLFIPIYFWKKTLSLFDAPNLQPYLTDFTPKWFTPIERIFGMLSFCGFISFIIILMNNFFFKKNEIRLLTWPIILFVISFILLHAIGHVEGRFVFAAIPFLITILFLGFMIAKKSNKTFLTIWTCAMVISNKRFHQLNFNWQ